MLVDVGDTRLHVTERGSGALALFVLHGGPGLDHTMFGSYLDALGDDCRLLLVDERSTGRSEPSAPETWTLERHAADVEALAAALGAERYAVLGHSYGALIALQHAVDFPGRPVGTVVSSGVPDARYLPRGGPARARHLRADRAARAGQGLVGARGRGPHAGGHGRDHGRPDAVSLRRPARSAHRRAAGGHGRGALRPRRAARGGERRLRRGRG